MRKARAAEGRGRGCEGGCCGGGGGGGGGGEGGGGVGSRGGMKERQDTERYADCHTNVYTAATPESETAPHSTTSLTPARIGRTPWPPEIFAAQREAFRVTNRRI